MDMPVILAADDDRDICELLKTSLESEGYICLTARDGAEAQEIMARERVSLVIMDVMMPRQNGLLTTAKIREKSNVPILMLSARTEEQDRVLGLEMGADDYLSKPFFKSELLARVRSLLRRYYELGSFSDTKGALRYYSLTLEPEKKRLLKDGAEIKLTATEFRIVELLLSRPGRVFSAREIYERVWDSEAYAAENTVTVHLSRIRQKLETDPERPEYLKVVWGIGYKIEK